MFFFCSNMLPLLNGKGVSDWCTSWREALRCLWGLNYRTHCDIVTGLSEQLPLLLNLQLRFCKFINKCLVNENEILKFVSNVAISNPMSNTGKNYLELYSRHNEGLVVDKVVWHEKYNTISADIQALVELISIRDGAAQCLLDKQEVNQLIEFICLF